MKYLTLTYTGQFYVLSLLFAVLVVFVVFGLLWLFEPAEKGEEAEEANVIEETPFPVSADPVDRMLSPYYMM